MKELLGEYLAEVASALAVSSEYLITVSRLFWG